jgi:Holliday junction resolvase
VVWCLREMGCEVVRMCTETSTVLGAPLADILLDCGELEILTEDRVRHIERNR